MDDPRVIISRQSDLFHLLFSELFKGLISVSNIIYFCFVVLKMEPRVLHMLGKCFTTELHPQAL
jgi:hypothetical protein